MANSCRASRLGSPTAATTSPKEKPAIITDTLLNVATPARAKSTASWILNSRANLRLSESRCTRPRIPLSSSQRKSDKEHHRAAGHREHAQRRPARVGRIHHERQRHNAGCVGDRHLRGHGDDVGSAEAQGIDDRKDQSGRGGRQQHDVEGSMSSPEKQADAGSDRHCCRCCRRRPGGRLCRGPSGSADPAREHGSRPQTSSARTRCWPAG